LANVCPDDGGRISVMIFWTVAIPRHAVSIARSGAKRAGMRRPRGNR
jgi:hypothetical protein